MFCKYCGKQLSDGAKFCENCGAAVNSSSEPKVVVRPPEVEVGNTQVASGVKSKAISGFVWSFFVPIVGLILSIIALKRYGNLGTTDGKGFAKAGLIISIVSMVISTIVYIVLIATAGETGYYDGGYYSYY